MFLFTKKIIYFLFTFHVAILKIHFISTKQLNLLPVVFYYNNLVPDVPAIYSSIVHVVDSFMFVGTNFLGLRTNCIFKDNSWFTCILEIHGNLYTTNNY